MEVRSAIQQIALEHRRRYGYRRITAELHRREMQVNHKRVARIMREDMEGPVNYGTTGNGFSFFPPEEVIQVAVEEALRQFHGDNRDLKNLGPLGLLGTTV